jgi:hypothetical protein
MHETKHAFCLLALICPRLQQTALLSLSGFVMLNFVKTLGAQKTNNNFTLLM